MKTLREQWKPMPEVLRGYAKDMDTNTRLIDGDIAPYLRKVADWIEAPRTISADAFVAMTARYNSVLLKQPLNSLNQPLAMQAALETLGITVGD